MTPVARSIRCNTRKSASHVHLPAAKLTGWLGSADSRGSKGFLQAKSESRCALLHASEGHSGYSPAKCIGTPTSAHWTVPTGTGGSQGLCASQAQPRRIPRPFVHFTALYVRTNTSEPVRARSNNCVDDTHLSLGTSLPNSNEALHGQLQAGRDRRPYMCESAVTDVAAALCGLVGSRAGCRRFWPSAARCVGVAASICKGSTRASQGANKHSRTRHHSMHLRVGATSMGRRVQRGATHTRASTVPRHIMSIVTGDSTVQSCK